MRIGIKSALTLLVAASGSVEGPLDVPPYKPSRPGRMRPIEAIDADIEIGPIRSPEHRREQREARKERRRARKRTGFR